MENTLLLVRRCKARMSLRIQCGLMSSQSAAIRDTSTSVGCTHWNGWWTVKLDMYRTKINKIPLHSHPIVINQAF